MKLIVAGGRDTHFNDEFMSLTNAVLDTYNINEVVHGGCRGIDIEAGGYVKGCGYKETVFPADWRMHGKAAGPIRNESMAQYGDILLAFPGGRGTQDMVDAARRHSLIIIRRY